MFILYSRCTRNCLPKLAIDTKFSLSVVCAECSPADTAYTWKIYRWVPLTLTYVEITNYAQILDTCKVTIKT